MPHRHRHRPARRVAAVVALSLLAAPALAGCAAPPAPPRDTGSSAPSTPTSGSATSTPTSGSATSSASDPALARAATADELVAAVRPESMQRDLDALMAIARDHGGNRAAGTPGYDASVDHVVAELEKAGYEVRIQRFPITYRENVPHPFTLSGSTADPIDYTVLRYSPPIHAKDAPLVAPSVADGCEVASWGRQKLAGAVALVSRGGYEMQRKSAVAKALGAQGVVVYNDEEGPLHSTLSYPHEGHAGTVAVSREAGQRLLAQARSGRARVSLDVDERVEERTSANVIAETKAGDDDHVVMVGAHLDSVPFGAGVHDNASGVAATLELARGLAGVETNRNKVRFVLWGAEEIGLRGARHYAQTITDAEAADIALYVNADMVAPADAGDPVEILQGPWSRGAERLLKDQLDRDGERSAFVDADGHSDYGPLLAVGVPVTGLLSEHDAHNHTPQDDLGNVSLPVLTHSARALGRLVGTTMNDQSVLTPR